jgi:hypothetical protein
MKTLILLTALLAGCATPGYEPMAPEARWQSTAPGSELPAFFDTCVQANAQGLCTKWSTGSGKIRPYDVPATAAKP